MGIKWKKRRQGVKEEGGTNVKQRYDRYEDFGEEKETEGEEKLRKRTRRKRKKLGGDDVKDGGFRKRERGRIWKNGSTRR